MNLLEILAQRPAAAPGEMFGAQDSSDTGDSSHPAPFVHLFLTDLSSLTASTSAESISLKLFKTIRQEGGGWAPRAGSKLLYMSSALFLPASNYCPLKKTPQPPASSPQFAPCALLPSAALPPQLLAEK